MTTLSNTPLPTDRIISSTCKWWKEQIVYQIYPRSFKDSSGNGVGDLRGIIDKLDYIASLGITAVWINPIYASPNDDNGYDISDYRAIMPEFGTMADFDELIEGLHKHNIRFIMDLVVNHSSDEHEWFKQSRSSRDNPYRDYYHWWPAEKGKPNYRWSFFDEKGEAWQYDKPTDAYYLHYFSKKQPDLKWENPQVRQEVYDIMKFWLKKGVDGFRLDAFQFVSKDTSFPKLPDGYEQSARNVIKHHGMGPNIHEYLQEMYTEVLSQYDTFAVSEGAGSSFEDAHSLVDEERNELQMVYHFEAVDMGKDIHQRHTLDDFKDIHSAWDKSFAEKGWLSIFLANHDSPRMVSKFGDDRPQFRALSAKLLNTFLLSMRGTSYCYFGDELGMTNSPFTSIDEYQDIAAINGYKKMLHEGGDKTDFMATLSAFSRDHSRTPMQWDDSEYAGFSRSQPWLPAHSNKNEVNVKAQEIDPQSVLNHFRKMTDLRKRNKVLVYGKYTLLKPEHQQVYLYLRELKDKDILSTQAPKAKAPVMTKMLVALNFSDHCSLITIPKSFKSATLLINNSSTFELSGVELNMKPYQAIILGIYQNQ